MSDASSTTTSRTGASMRIAPTMATTTSAGARSPGLFQRSPPARTQPHQRNNGGTGEYEEDEHVSLLTYPTPSVTPNASTHNSSSSSSSHHHPKYPTPPPPTSASSRQTQRLFYMAYGFALTCCLYYFVVAPGLLTKNNNNIQTQQGTDLSGNNLMMMNYGGRPSSYMVDLESDPTLIDTIWHNPLPSIAATSVSTSSSSSAVVAMTHRLSPSSAPCSTCTFSFPRPPPGSPTSSFFLTAVPNHGAGVGHQFTEWAVGVWLARALNLTYIYTDLLKQSARWNSFLGLAEGELTVEDLYNTYGGVSRRLQVMYPKKGEPDWGKWGVLNWTTATVHNITNDPAIRAMNIDHSALTVAQRSLTPGIPFPVLIETKWVAVPLHQVVCEPVTYRLIRQKYCAARIRNPVRQDLYAADRAEGKIIITWHLRCGDECYSPYRSTSFQSIIFTSFKLQKLFEKLEPHKKLIFHFFSQNPSNDTAEHHFAPLMKSLEPLETRQHWTTKSHVVLHHLITSDVLFGAMSGFSWLAFLHHNGVAMGTIPGCMDTITYDKYTGIFNETEFEHAWRKYKAPKFDTFQDCLDIV